MGLVIKPTAAVKTTRAIIIEIFEKLLRGLCQGDFEYLNFCVLITAAVLMLFYR